MTDHVSADLILVIKEALGAGGGVKGTLAASIFPPDLLTPVLLSQTRAQSGGSPDSEMTRLTFAVFRWHAKRTLLLSFALLTSEDTSNSFYSSAGSQGNTDQWVHVLDCVSGPRQCKDEGEDTAPVKSS